MFYMFIVVCSVMTHHCDIRQSFQHNDKVVCEAKLDETLSDIRAKLSDIQGAAIFGSCTTINLGDPT